MTQNSGRARKADQPGTLMIFDLANQVTAPVGPDTEIRRVTTVEDLHGFIAASDLAFNHAPART